jgi:hypothetical protein
MRWHFRADALEPASIGHRGPCRWAGQPGSAGLLRSWMRAARRGTCLPGNGPSGFSFGYVVALRPHGPRPPNRCQAISTGGRRRIASGSPDFKGTEPICTVCAMRPRDRTAGGSGLRGRAPEVIHVLVGGEGKLEKLARRRGRGKRSGVAASPSAIHSAGLSSVASLHREIVNRASIAFTHRPPPRSNMSMSDSPGHCRAR